MAKNRLPANVKRLRGTYRKHREQRNESLERGIPKRPSGMTKQGSKYWEILIDRLDRIGSLTEVDDLSVMITAEALGEYMEACRFLEENGRTYEFINAKGEASIRPRPELKIANDAWTRVFAMFKQYGLTHISRNNLIPAPSKKPPSVWEKV